MNKWFPTLLVLFATFFWGTTFIMVQAAINLLPVNFFLFLRFLFATLLTLPLILYRAKLADMRVWKYGLVLGLLLFASYYFQTVGLLFTTPANAAFITGMNVIFIPIFGYFLFSTPITPRMITATLLSFFGTALLTINFSTWSLNVGDSIIILTAISIAFHILLTEQAVSSEMVELLWVQFLVMTACAGILALFSQPPAITWYTSPVIIFTLLVTVILATIFAFAAQFYAQQQRVPATMIGILFSMEPVFALLVDLLVGTVPSALTLVGMGCIFIAILTITIQTSQPSVPPGQS